MAWHTANAQLLAALFLKRTYELTPRDGLGWVLLLDYLIYVTLPLRLRYCVMLSLGTCACYLAAIVGLGRPVQEANVVEQVSGGWWMARMRGDFLLLHRDWFICLYVSNAKEWDFVL